MTNSPSMGKQISLMLMIYLDALSYFLLIPILMRLFIDQHFGLASASHNENLRYLLFEISLSVSSLAGILTSPILGRLADLWGRKKILWICLLASFGGYFFPWLGLLYASVTLLLFGRVLSGLAYFTQFLAQAMVADLHQGKTRAYYFSLLSFAMTLAMVTGPILGGMLSDPNLVSWFSVRTPLVFAGALALFNLGLMYFCIDDTFKLDVPSFSLKALPWQTLSLNLKALLFIFLVFQFYWASFFQYLPIYLHQYFLLKTSTVSYFFTGMGCCMCFAQFFLFKNLHARFGLSSLLILLLGISMILIGLVTLQSHLLIFILILGGLSLAAGLIYPTLISLVSYETDSNSQGWIMGLAATLMSVAWFASGFTLGPLMRFNLFSPLFTALFLVFITFICVLYYKPSQAKGVPNV